MYALKCTSSVLFELPSLVVNGWHEADIGAVCDGL